MGDYRGVTEIKTAKMFTEKKCCWEAKDGSPASTALKQLLPKIIELFQASADRVPDSAMILLDIFMLGEKAEECVPYIMFSSPNTCKAARIKAMNLVKRSNLLDGFPGLKVSHWEFPPHIPDPQLMIEAHIPLTTTSPEEPNHSDESSTGNRGDRSSLEVLLSPTCNGKVDDRARSQKSTIGAIIRFGHCVLYFTAAHMLPPGRDDLSQQGSQEGDTDDLDDYDSEYFSEDDSAYESEERGESIEPSRIGQQRRLSAGQDMPIHGLNSSCRNSSLNSDTEPFGTPIQDDPSSVISQSSSTSSFTNREVFFKSQELDFALLDLSDLEVPPNNIPELDYDTVSAIRAGFTQVVAITGSRRDLRGQMSGRPSYIRFPHGSIYQEVYPIIFSAAVKVGDSGTIVRDARTGAIYGHIVVASIESRTAFIVPATQVLRTIPWLKPAASTIYTRLDYNSGQIRLVRLLPPNLSGNGICCELSLAWLRDGPKYEALSYVWGKEEVSTPILLNGQPWNVRPVLAAALRRLRYQDKERYIWVDALCIDQSNGFEKSGQTQHMKDVFGGSERCLVWLGDVYDEPFSWTFSLPHLLTDQASRDGLSWQDADLAFGLITEFWNLEERMEFPEVDVSGLCITSASQQALGRLMDLPWWKGFWPFQSAIFAQASTLICGTMNMDLDVFGRSAFTLRRCLLQRAWRRRGDGLDFDVLIPFMQTAGRMHRFRHSRVPDNFAFNLNAMRDLTCSGPQAKALAFLHHFYDVKTATDIRRRHGPNQICEAITAHHLRSTNSLLPLVRTTEIGRNKSLPSWVPDWSASIESKPQFHSELSFLMSWNIFDASSGRETLMSIRNHELHVQGVLVDVVSNTNSLMGPGNNQAVLTVNLATPVGGVTANQSSKLLAKGKTSQTMKAIPIRGGTDGIYRGDFWRLLTCDIRIAEQDEMEWRRAGERDREACPREYQNGLLGHGVRGRRLFSTKMNYFGLGPSDMKVGDVVVVLYGGRFPFILRPRVNHKYNLVGHAYVLGIMDGEAMSDNKATRTFQIV